jgi:hypothetical protein
VTASETIANHFNGRLGVTSAPLSRNKSFNDFNGRLGATKRRGASLHALPALAALQ